jgi:hypothetical protein
LGPVAAFGAAAGTAMARGVGDRLASLFAGKAVDAAQAMAIASALQGVTNSISSEIENYIFMIKPYATKGYYTFIICAALYALNSANNLTGGLIGEGIRATILAILRLGRSLASMTASGAIKFARASVKFLKWLASADSSDYIKQGARKLANAIGHRVKSVKEAASKLKGMAARAKVATMDRLRRAAASVGAVRARFAKYRTNRAEKAKLAKNAAELKKVINKVRKSSAPLTLVEKKKYLKVAHKANQNAQKAARNTAAAANQMTAMQAATALGKRRRNASPGKKLSRARVTMVSVRSTGSSM